MKQRAEGMSAPELVRVEDWRYLWEPSDREFQGDVRVRDHVYYVLWEGETYDIDVSEFSDDDDEGDPRFALYSISMGTPGPNTGYYVYECNFFDSVAEALQWAVAELSRWERLPQC